MMGDLFGKGDSDSIGCRIVVDGVVKAEQVTNETHAFTFLPGEVRVSSQTPATNRTPNGHSLPG